MNISTLKFKHFTIYTLISVVIAFIGAISMNFLYFKNVFKLVPLVLILTMFLYLVIIKKFLKSKNSLLFVALSIIIYYELFFWKWMSIQYSGEDDLGLGILIYFYNLTYLICIIITSILGLIINKNKPTTI